MEGFAAQEPNVPLAGKRKVQPKLEDCTSEAPMRASSPPLYASIEDHSV
jgi:hypothetical protein